MIGRRQASMLIAAAAAWPVRALGQAQRRRSVAVIAPNAQQLVSFAIFREALTARGQGEAAGVSLAVRFAEDHPGGLAGLMAETIAGRPDVIVTVNTPVARAALEARPDASIVMAVVGDRAGEGSARIESGREVTGVTTLAGHIAAKRLALLREAAPSATRVLALHHPDDPIIQPQLQDLAEAAPRLGVELMSAGVREPAELDAVVARAEAWGARAVFRLVGQTAATLQRTIALCRELKWPSMLVLQEDARQGGLMSYYASFDEHWERVAIIVDRILKGTPARELPIEQPTRFELVLNLQTARVIGLSLSPAFLARADEVIE